MYQTGLDVYHVFQLMFRITLTPSPDLWSSHVPQPESIVNYLVSQLSFSNRMDECCCINNLAYNCTKMHLKWYDTN